MKTTLSVLMSLFVSTSFAAPSALDAAKKIAGKYRGNWVMYGLTKGAVVEKFSWTDVLVASAPTDAPDRAFVEIEDIMTYPDGSKRTTKFREGYLKNPDGTAGDRFYDIQGTVTVFKKLTDDDWVYHAVPDSGELRLLGFNPAHVLASSHVATKTTTYEGGRDTDHVTRLTTVQWKERGAVRSLQFVSLKGVHTRVP